MDRVAFASDAVAVFENQDHTPKDFSGYRVLLYATKPQHGAAELFVPEKASFEGIFVGWVRADPQGRHHDPSVRPLTTIEDGPVIGFWEIAELTRLAKEQYVPLSSMYPLGTGKPLKGTAVRRPLLVNIR
jgi:hypothetical protein